ncbi:hypothetical protein I6N90_21555 [Paenibacillus sp. GSMTC-2017]|uniref:hypothetical protein n=1 Tax=Paenibacillus sp. GSMTC-2017 TaxID=2794350 RepID=UPI0018D7D788|nr:hypothetical protein [Paenibacillus sp. GSMTC-2017]MBH5320383.1 hypothetical protein [Paenibacillus sp. GSMTC-2017]
MIAVSLLVSSLLIYFGVLGFFVYRIVKNIKKPKNIVENAGVIASTGTYAYIMGYLENFPRIPLMSLSAMLFCLYLIHVYVIKKNEKR